MLEKAITGSFAIALANCQTRLYAYIMALSMDRNVADEILQATNLALCEHAGNFSEVRDFTAWACKTAYLKTLEYRKSHQRRRLLFDSSLIESIAEESTAAIGEFSTRQQFLHDCLKSLPGRQREMILSRYDTAGSVEQIAAKSGRSVKSIYQALYRIRSSLLACINRKLAKEAQG
jgi:RNA polymerase sigma-70 factor (ECF subfamily)